MTSRSRKNHLTTVPTCLAEILCKARPATFALLSRGGLAAAIVLASGGLSLQAQSPTQGATLRPVPKFGESTTPTTQPAAQRSATWNLQWRKSGQTQPAAVPTESPAQPQQLSAQPRQLSAQPQQLSAQPAPSVPVRKLVDLDVPANQRAIAQTSYRQRRAEYAVQPAAFQNQDGADSSLQLPPSLEPPTDADGNTDIFDDFENPFQDDAMQSPVNPLDNPRSSLPPLDAADPAATDPGSEQPELGMPQPATPDELPPPRTNPMRDPASPYDRGALPDDPYKSDPYKSDPYKSDPYKSDMEPTTPDPEAYINPFDRGGADSEPDSTGDSRDGDVSGNSRGGVRPSRVKEFSCDAFRDRIDARTIDRISLDISPQFRPDILEADDLEQERRKFNEKQGIREWRSMDGFVMTRGRLKDLAYEKVLVEAEHGGVEEISLNRISEADLAYISEQWGLPTECRIRQETHTPRNWTPSQVAWKASGLCHKPLYFEEVNLERYGHTAGPVAQPLLSTAHFFVNIAVLPYKMGIHPPTECQYTLGYYRPGSCAPWVVPPVPISLRGALAEAAVVGGFVGLIP